MNVDNIRTFEVVADSYEVTIDDKNDFLARFGSAFKSLEVSPQHPQTVGTGWAKDGKYYYFGPSRVEGADYASFKVVPRGPFDSPETASDKNRQYRGPFPVEK
jgi:DKNYY family